MKSIKGKKCIGFGLLVQMAGGRITCLFKFQLFKEVPLSLATEDGHSYWNFVKLDVCGTLFERQQCQLLPIYHHNSGVALPLCGVLASHTHTSVDAWERTFAAPPPSCCRIVRDSEKVRTWFSYFCLSKANEADYRKPQIRQQRGTGFRGILMKRVFGCQRIVQLYPGWGTEYSWRALRIRRQGGRCSLVWGRIILMCVCGEGWA